VSVKLFCPGVVFSEAAAISSSSVQNLASVSIRLNRKLGKMNSGKNLNLARLGILNAMICLKVQVLGITDCFRFRKSTPQGNLGMTALPQCII